MRMKQFRLWMLVVLLLIPSAALGAEELAVWQTNIRMYDDLPVGRIFAKVQNTGDAPFGMGGATLTVYDGQDEVLLQKKYVMTSAGPIILAPGEYIYISNTIMDFGLQGKEPAHANFTIASTAAAKKRGFLACETAAELKGAGTYDNFLYITFTNTTPAPIDNINVTAALLDENGGILFADTTTTGPLALHPGRSVTMKIPVSESIVRLMEARQETAASVDAIVSYIKE